MRYIFLIAGLWNSMGAVNFILLPATMASQYGYRQGNMWEYYFMGGIAVVYALIYFSFFKKEPSRDMLYLVYFFALGKIWVFASNIYCVAYHKMPPSLAAVLGGGNLIMGLLFILYIILAKRKFSNIREQVPATDK